MKDKLDTSQFGYQKGLSIQHYLIKMIHKILTSLDNNSKGDVFAVIAAERGNTYIFNIRQSYT